MTFEIDSDEADKKHIVSKINHSIDNLLKTAYSDRS
jgi:hypothetical protein